MANNKKIDAKKIKNVPHITSFNKNKQQYNPTIFPHGIKVDLDHADFRRGIEITPGTAPPNTANKLYNDNGTLMFNGSNVGAGAGGGASAIGWQGTAGIIYQTGSLGIGGVSDPAVKLVVSGTSTQLKLSYDADDYATFAVANTGDLTISTFGAGSVDSHLILDVDGNIELNADGGTIWFTDDLTTLGRIHTTALDINVGIDVDAGVNAIDMLTDYPYAGAITLTSQGGTGQTIFIRNDGGTRTDAIKFQTDDGGITLDANSVVVVTEGAKFGIGTTTPLTSFVDIQDYDTTAFTSQLSNTQSGGHVLKCGSGTTVAGQLYFLHTDGSWDSTDSSSVTTGADQLLGIALGTSPSSNGILLRGYARIGSSMINGTAAIGKAVYVSETASEYDFTAPSTSGDFVRVVGYCVDKDATPDILLYFNPDFTWVELT